MWNYILIGLSLLWFAGSKAKESILSKLQFGFGGINFDLANFRFLLSLTLFNPLPTKISINSIQAELLLNGQKIADIFRTIPTEINPGNNTIQLTGIPLAGNIYAQVGNLAGKLELAYTITAGPLSYTTKIYLRG